MPRPDVSVILPAYKARETLPRALASILRCGLPAGQIEVVLASDDGCDHRDLVPPGLPVSVTPVGPVATGPGAARNRALQQARGEFIAFLDADDSWEPGYLSALLPLARRHGAAFGATSVLEGEQQILRLPEGRHQLTLEDLGAEGASFHPVLPRSQARPFTSHLSQDVRHAVELLARLGGRAPLGHRAYQLRLGMTSVTAAAGFSARVSRAYRSHIAEIEAGVGDIPFALRPACAEVFRAKARLNDSYCLDARPKESFYAFIARTRDRGALPGTTRCRAAAATAGLAAS
ncbi:MAG: glycosyltransferase family 2 protein [Rhodobacteraceae bacterium]|nr:glycosyltransferase family 2 protein [Paracoccaceae bacterium]MBR9820623.1 glycosyltransferase family 2 protein [Paracoccaceae bacterium]